MSELSVLNGQFALTKVRVDPHECFMELIQPGSGVKLAISADRGSKLFGRLAMTPLSTGGVNVSFDRVQVPKPPAPAAEPMFAALPKIDLVALAAAKSTSVEEQHVPDWMLAQARGRLAWKRFQKSREAIAESFGAWGNLSDALREAISRQQEDLTRVHGMASECCDVGSNAGMAAIADDLVRGSK